MKYHTILSCVLIVLSLSACAAPNKAPVLTAPQLPPYPIDLKMCLDKGPVFIPEKDLTVEEVEKLWKTDRYRLVVMRKCGKRIQLWYNDLRKEWK